MTGVRRVRELENVVKASWGWGRSKVRQNSVRVSLSVERQARQSRAGGRAYGRRVRRSYKPGLPKPGSNVPTSMSTVPGLASIILPC
jgi:uncharacterized Zn finger protein